MIILCNGNLKVFEYVDCGIMNEPFAMCKNHMVVLNEVMKWWLFNSIPTIWTPIQVV